MGKPFKADPERFLLIPDLQHPFAAPKALDFATYVKKHFRIPNENCLCLGDEVDQYFGGLYKKSPDALHSPSSELAAAKKELGLWFKRFPIMRVNTSNHGSRWARKAVEAEIPSQLMRGYQDLLDAPEGWSWRKYWKVNNIKQPFMTEHGDDWGGQFPHMSAALHQGMSVAMGHHHSRFGVQHIKTAGQQIWGMVCGALIDFDAYAFEYARKSRLKPVNGVGVVLDSGKMPILVPYD